MILYESLRTETGNIGGTGWTSFIPSWTNVTVGSGTNIGRYCRIGKTICYYVQFTFGAGSAVSGQPTLTLPVAMVATIDGLTVIGAATLTDNGGASGWYSGFQIAGGQVYVNQVYTQYVGGGGINATTPWTWATGDEIICQGFYEAA